MNEIPSDLSDNLLSSSEPTDLQSVDSGSEERPPRRTLTRGVFFPHAAILGIAVFFFILYSNTFRGHQIHQLTHGPFNFECGIYRDYAMGKKDISKTGDNKLIKHFLCATLYPVFNKAIFRHLGTPDSPLVCSGLGAATIALFGVWMYRRTKKSLVVFPLMLLLGFSFNTWYVSSIWESRAFIMFGAILLLLSLDWFIKRPGIPGLIFCILATVFSLLITIGNAYLIPLAPFAFLLSLRRIGFRKFIGWTVIYLFLVTLLVGMTYHTMGRILNPILKVDNLIDLSLRERKMIGAKPQRFTGENYRNVALQALVYGVGAPYLPCGCRMADREWANMRAIRAYFYYPRGILFVTGYTVLIIIVLIVICGKLLFVKEPVLWVMALWAFLYISFFVYFNPWAGSGYAAELQPVFWGFMCLVLGSLRWKRLAALLLIPAIILCWNNYLLIDFFKYFYGGTAERAAFVTPPPMPTFRAGGV